MKPSPLSAGMLERLERINMSESDRAEARLQLGRAVALVDALFSAIEYVTTRGRRARRKLRVFLYQQKRRHASA